MWVRVYQGDVLAVMVTGIRKVEGIDELVRVKAAVLGRHCCEDLLALLVREAQLERLDAGRELLLGDRAVAVLVQAGKDLAHTQVQPSSRA